MLRKQQNLVALLAVLLLLAACSRPDPGLFATPEDAVQAMARLVGQNDDAAIEEVFGPGSADLFRSGDDAADAEDAARVKTWIEARVEFEEFDENTLVVLLGEESWPWPIPLVREGEGWRFNTAEGREELLNRRIGRNELWTLAAMHGIVDAQHEYHGLSFEGKAPAFAAKFLSSEGARDGLYWPAAEGEELSPLGDALADSEAGRDDSQPFHGYYYRMLAGQGAYAPGGEQDYRDEQGNLSLGFAVVAWPAKYGNSGVMTFITNHRGLVWQKDLGENTAEVAAQIESFDPDASWTPTADQMSGTSDE